MVEIILAAKQRGAEADTSALERELVYAIYGLSKDKIVEDSANMKGSPAHV
ncbi:MAG: hypothetical protein WCQ21_09415 [Verrucomicrobiota bacterium]